MAGDSDGGFVPALWTLGPDQKLGLALSGGGFRASLFHIGVLARMAELDLLRHVGVLSTVSGGSIIGAYYYLKVKQLLEGDRKDAQGAVAAPSSEAYVEIVREIETEFLDAVQTNVRMRALLDPVANAKMIFADDYSRSDRIAEIYDVCFYRRFSKDEARKIALPDLLITPSGMQPGFNVHDYNRTADYKIPILNINATTLNTGGRWVFTAEWLGEAEPAIGAIGKIPPLKQIRYSDAGLSEKQRNKLAQIGLAEAVAASACVPAIFAPLAIHDLYEPGPNGEEIVVELVDGGVYDNQGLDALISQGCDHVICSDASGQIEENRTPSSQLWPVATRANEILMTRVRSECYANLGSCPGDGKFAFFHLRDAFVGTAGYPPLPGPADRCGDESSGHIYALSSIRTDLDAFSDIEAYTLMYDGYCLSDYFLQRDSNNAGLGQMKVPWRFLAIRRLVETQKPLLLHRLQSGKYLFFKAFYTDPKPAFAVAVLLLAPVLLLAFENGDLIGAFYDWFVQTLLYWGLPVAMAAAIVAAIVKGMDDAPLVLKLFDLIRKYRNADNRFLVGFFYAPGLAAAGLAWLHLKFYNKIYLKAGRLPS